MKTYLIAILAVFAVALMTACTPNDETDTAVEEGAVEGADAVSDASEEALEEAEDATDDDGVGEEILDETTDWGTSGAVKSALLDNDELDSTDINVDTEEDVVHLRGWVRNQEDMDLAVKIAKEAAGINYEVVNELEIGDPDDGEDDDTEGY